MGGRGPSWTVILQLTWKESQAVESSGWEPRVPSVKPVKDMF